METLDDVYGNVLIFYCIKASHVSLFFFKFFMFYSIFGQTTINASNAGYTMIFINPIWELGMSTVSLSQR